MNRVRIEYFTRVPNGVYIYTKPVGLDPNDHTSLDNVKLVVAVFFGPFYFSFFYNFLPKWSIFDVET